MENYSITTFIASPKEIHDYFFEHTDQLLYEKRLHYFISNSIMTSEYNSQYYFSLPFKIFAFIYASSQSPNIKLTNSLYLPTQIWSINNFKSSSISFVSHKIKLITKLTNHIDVFLNAFYTHSVVKLSDIFNLQSEMKENDVEQHLIEFPSFGMDADEEADDEAAVYLKVLLSFLKKSVEMHTLLNCMEMKGFDWDSKEECGDDCEDESDGNRKEIVHKYRMKITKYYAFVITKLILNDVAKIAIRYIKDNK